jgi:hypothetical protein
MIIYEIFAGYQGCRRGGSPGGPAGTPRLPLPGTAGNGLTWAGLGTGRILHARNERRPQRGQRAGACQGLNGFERVRPPPRE